MLPLHHHHHHHHTNTAVVAQGTTTTQVIATSTTNTFVGMDTHVRIGLNTAKMSAMMHAVGQAGKHAVKHALHDAVSVGVGMEMGAVLAGHMAVDGMHHMLHGLHHAEAVMMKTAMDVLETSASAILAGIEMTGEVALGTVMLAVDGAEMAGSAAMHTFEMVAVGGYVMLRNTTMKMEDMMLITLPQLLMYAKAELSGLILMDMDMTQVNTTVTTTVTKSVDLTQANLQAAVLLRSNFSGVILHQANLAGANCCGVNFGGAVLTEVNILGAQFDASTNFAGATISLALPDWSIASNLHLHLDHMANQAKVSLLTTIHSISDKAVRVALMAQLVGSLTAAHLVNATDTLIASMRSIIMSDRAYLKNAIIKDFVKTNLTVEFDVSVTAAR